MAQFEHMAEDYIADGERYFVKSFCAVTEGGTTINFVFELFEAGNSKPLSFTSLSMDASQPLRFFDVIVAGASLIGICIARKLFNYGIDQVRRCYDQSVANNPNLSTSERATDVAKCLGGSGSQLVSETLKALNACTGGSSNQPTDQTHQGGGDT